MKAWLIASLLAVFGLAASSDMVAVAGQAEMDSMLANISRNLAVVAKMPTDNLATNTDKNKLRRAAAIITTPYSQSVFVWGAGSKSCAAKALTVNITCATGAAISLVPSSQFGVSKCTKVGTNTIKCTKLASASAATVGVKCTSKYSVTVTARLPKVKFTGCKSSEKGNFAYQAIVMAQRCAINANVRNYTSVYSKQCGVASQLVVDGSTNISSCQSTSFNCVKTTTTTCSITTDAVTISTPATTNALCILN